MDQQILQSSFRTINKEPVQKEILKKKDFQFTGLELLGLKTIGLINDIESINESSLSLGSIELPKLTKRILIVDDQLFNINALIIMLRCFTTIKPEEVCDTAMDGLECLEKVKENIDKNQGTYCDYQIIFMDCNMPFMDGYQATGKVREMLYEKNLRQPIISAVTGHSDQSFVDKAIESGMNQVLEKPVKPQIIKKLIDQYF